MQFFSLEHALNHTQFPIARFYAGYLARRASWSEGWHIDALLSQS